MGNKICFAFTFIYLQFDDLDALKRVEKFIWENAFEQKTKNPRLKFNPELRLIGLRTTGSRLPSFYCNDWRD